jgi:hypothetical protein
VLIVTAEAGRPFRWNPHGIELLILMALILVMAGTTLLWRYSSRLPDSQTPPATIRRSEGGKNDRPECHT